MKKHMLKALLCTATMLALSPLSPFTSVAHADGLGCGATTIIEWRSPGDIEVDFNLPDANDGDSVTVDGIAWGPYGPLASTETRSFTCSNGNWY